MSKNITEKLNANGVEIRTVLGINEQDYISLTDIAKYKNSDFPADVVKNWMRIRNTIEFLGLWEQLNNPNFKLVEFDQFKNNAGSNGFVLPPQQWVAKTNAIGIISKSGRYGGTYAHTDIAFEFASWISPEFKLYIIKDYQRLKNNENVKNQLEWNAKRELSKANYKIHTDAVKEYLIADLPKDYASRVYANEADLLNMALFGMTAKEWRTANPDRKKENSRDDASALQLTVLFNLETLNAHFIQQGFPSAERVKLLHDIAESQLKRLEGNASIKRLENVIKKK